MVIKNLADDELAGFFNWLEVIPISRNCVQKERHPALDAGSPYVDIIRRSRIVVRDDEIDNFPAIPRSFWTVPILKAHRFC